MGPPSGQFLRLLYGARPLRSISLLPMWGPLQISFFAYYIGGPLRSFSSPIRGPQFSFFIYYMGPPQINFFASYVGASSDHFLRILYSGPLRSFSSPIGGPQFSFFAYYMGPPGRPPQINFFASYVGASSDQFLRILYRGPLQVNFFAYYMWRPP